MGTAGEVDSRGLLLPCLFIDHVTLPGLIPLPSSVNTHGGKACQHVHKDRVAGMGNMKSSTVHLLSHLLLLSVDRAH